MSEAKKVYAAIHAVLDDLSKIGISKDGWNAQQKFKFRGIDAVYATLSSLLAKHRLLILPRVTSREVLECESKSGNAMFRTTLSIDFDLVSVDDGSSHTITMIGEAMDSGDKGCNKAESAAYKYACIQAFCIPIEGSPDADSESPEVKKSNQEPEKINQEALIAFKELIKRADVDEKVILEHYSLAGLDVMNVNQMDEAVDRLNKRISANSGQQSEPPAKAEKLRGTKK